MNTDESKIKCDAIECTYVAAIKICSQYNFTKSTVPRLLLREIE